MSSVESVASQEDALIKALETFKRMSYASFALVVLYAWDLVLTFPMEVDMWKTKFKMAKLLFFFNRYLSLLAGVFWVWTNVQFPMFDSNLQQYCLATKIGNDFTGIIAWLTQEVILLLHVFALFSFKRTVTVPVTALFIICWSIYVSGEVLELKYSLAVNDESLPSTGMCAVQVPGIVPYMLCVPMMVCDFVLVILIGTKTVRYHLTVMNTRWSGASLMASLARGAFVFYFITFLSVLLALLFWLLKPELVDIAGGFFFTIMSMAINHLVFRMRRTIEDQAYGDPELMASVSIRFGVGDEERWTEAYSIMLEDIHR